MSVRRIAMLLLLVAGWSAAPAVAQARVFVMSSLGGAFDLNDQDGRTGGGFGYQGGVGVSLRDVSFGGEAMELSYGNDRKARIIAGFVRLQAFSGPQVSPYLVLGIGAYRFSPVPNGSTTMVGGSLGPGAVIRLGESRVRLVIEARFHTTFNEYAQLTRQEIASAMAGLELGF